MTTLETLLSDPDTPGVWNLVPDRSSIGFKTRTTWGLSSVKGTFGDFSGDGQITAKGAVFGRIDIRAASLQTGNGKRDEHLRSADFFDVVNFPTISVVVTAVQPSTGNAAELRATLAVRSTTEPLPLPVTVTAQDDGTVRIACQTTIDRRQWEVSGNLLGMVGATTTLIADTVFSRVPE